MRGYTVNDSSKINEELIKEISVLKPRIQELEQSVLDHKKVEETLRESEAKYRLAFESTSDGIFTIDRNFNISSITPSVERQLGYKVEEVIDRPIQDLNILTSASLARAVSDVIQVLSGVEVTCAVYEFVARDGTRKIGEVTGTPIIREGKILGVTAVVRDISERKRIEEALAESENKYRLITEKMTDIVWIQNMNLRTVYVSPSIKAMLGFTPEERLAQDVHEQLTPASMSMALDVMAKELALEQQGQADPERKIIIELEYYHKDGSTRWIENIISGIRDNQGVLTGLHGVSRDITKRRQLEQELRESEQKYRELVDFLPISLYEMDVQGNIISGNPEIFKTFGYVQDDLKRVLNAFQLISPEDLDRALKTELMVLSGKRTGGTEYTGIRKDGSTFPFLNIASRIIHKGEPVGLRGAIIDLTQQKDTEKELQNARDQLIQVERLASIGRLSAGVAHEILNPLNIISLGLQFLQTRENLPLDVIEDIKISMTHVNRIVTIAESLKQFSRISGNEMVMADVNDVIANVLTLYSTQLTIDGIEIETHYQTDLPEIFMDKERMEQVLINLISNATAAMEGKEKKVLRITTRSNALNGDHDSLMIVVSDTGAGIKKEDMPRIFDPFFTTRQGKGTGLGLSISYGIVTDHGGKIWAENNKQGGASFMIELPVRTVVKNGSLKRDKGQELREG
jgi:PAS domain S-box-containing protein